LVLVEVLGLDVVLEDFEDLGFAEDFVDLVVLGGPVNCGLT
jgi:hypothetical protein